MNLLQSRREKTMAVLFGGALGLAVAAHLLDRFLFTPLSTRRDAIRTLRHEVQELEFESQLVRRAQSRLAERAEQGLSSDPVVATLACQTWLLDLARRSGLRDVQLNPGRAMAEENIGHRIPMVMTASGPFLGLVNFLDATRRQSGSVRLSHISAAANDAQGSDDLGFSVEIDALSLLDASEEGTPLPQSIPSSRSPEILALKRIASGSSPFARYQPPKPKSARPEEAVVQEEPGPAGPSPLTLIACGSRGALSEAWFHEAGHEEAIRAGVGDSLSHQGRQLRVTAIERDRVVIQDGGERLTIELGQNVAPPIH